MARDKIEALEQEAKNDIALDRFKLNDSFFINKRFQERVSFWMAGMGYDY